MFFIAFILAISVSVTNIHPLIVPVRAEYVDTYQAESKAISDSINDSSDLDYYLEVSNPEIQNQLRILEQKRIQLENEKKAEELRILEEQRLALEAQKKELARQKAIQAQKAKATVSMPGSSVNLQDSINQWCSAYGCDSSQLTRVMYCESGGNPSRTNGSYTGLFQFLPNTFYANAARAGISGADIWNASHQIQTATYMFANGQARQWGCK